MSRWLVCCLTLILISFPSILLCATASAGSSSVGSPVIYGVVPAFFGSQGLQDVTKRLTHLKALGVDVIWLSPLQQSDDIGAINYSVTDYFQLRPDVGTDADLKSLVTSAHALNLKVIIDFVPNHTSSAHPYFVDALNKGQGSPFYDHYERNSEGEYQYYFDWDYLPNLNYKNPAVVNMMTEAFLHWMQTYQVDGFRADVAWGIRERAPQVWPQIIERLRTQNPNVFLLAEAPAHDKYYLKNGFQLAYDWGPQLGHAAWEEVFESKTGIADRLQEALSAPAATAPGVLRFLNNNDTGKRFITRHGLRLFRAASVLQFTLPGASLLYSGDEVGAEYEPYEDPPSIVWNDRHGLTPFFKKLIQLRRDEEGFRSGDLQIIKTESAAAVFTFLRGENLLIAINFSGRSQSLDLKSVQTAKKNFAADTITDIWSNARFASSAEVKLSPYGFLILKASALPGTAARP